MIFFNRELARRKALQSALVSSILLFNMKSSIANKNVEEDSQNIDKPSQGSIQLNKNKVCPSTNLLPIRSFNTPKYYVYICRGDNKNLLGYYVRIPKNLDSKITVPITKKARETYIAINGELAYIITPYEMVITKRDRIILREKVISAVQADGKALSKGCPEGNNTFAKAETKSFFIYICGIGNPSSYVSVTRKSNRRINLPLKKWNHNSNKNDRYVATNGNIRFILTNKVLRVSRGERNVIKEKVLRWE
ncbi:MAG: hypothetical protein KI793_27515 [Rivularia sp. (in: Bacteria)]|nr:hypothetical protein [Rivularia sp. MS3]